jgi:hypothetical protein
VGFFKRNPADERVRPPQWVALANRSEIFASTFSSDDSAISSNKKQRPRHAEGACRPRRDDPSGPQFQLRDRGRRLVSNSVDGPTRTGAALLPPLAIASDQLRLFSGRPSHPATSFCHVLRWPESYSQQSSAINAIVPAASFPLPRGLFGTAGACINRE